MFFGRCARKGLREGGFWHFDCKMEIGKSRREFGNVKGTSKAILAQVLTDTRERGYIGPAVIKPQPQGTLVDRKKAITDTEQTPSAPQPSRPGVAVGAGQSKVQGPIEQLGVIGLIQSIDDRMAAGPSENRRRQLHEFAKSVVPHLKVLFELDGIGRRGVA